MASSQGGVGRGRRARALARATVALTAVVMAGCSSGSAPGAAKTTTTVPAGGVPQTDAAGTVWLCRPGLSDDPCAGDLEATAVAAHGSTVPRTAHPSAASRFDCFYVYPTVSTEPTDNADLTVQPAETMTAVAQAARFSQVCKVWAPMYRQRTEGSLTKGLGNDPAADAVAYASLLAGWKDYLAHDNHGRPIIFIGHSQGAAMLITLLRQQIDPDPARRRLMVSAIILGGDVEVPTGQEVGGSFQNISACQSATQIGCVIAYSSFLTTPTKRSLFGRPGQGVALQSGQTATAGVQVLCTNPADLAGGSGVLDPYFVALPTPRSSVSTPWVEYPNLYTAQCQSADGASWLQVKDIGTAADKRPRVSQTLGPLWGLHGDDVNLALGNLVQIVAQQEGAFS